MLPSVPFELWGPPGTAGHVGRHLLAELTNSQVGYYIVSSDSWITTRPSRSAYVWPCYCCYAQVISILLVAVSAFCAGLTLALFSLVGHQQQGSSSACPFFVPARSRYICLGSVLGPEAILLFAMRFPWVCCTLFGPA